MDGSVIKMQDSVSKKELLVKAEIPGQGKDQDSSVESCEVQSRQDFEREG